MISWTRSLAAALAAAFVALLLPAPVLAQSSSETGVIQITVVDAAKQGPLSDARVTLIGPTIASALTTQSGIVKYTDVPSGIYRVRITKSTYQGTTSAPFEVLGNKQVDVEVAMGLQKASAGQSTATSTTTSGLQIIGRVQARVTINTHDVDQDSSVRKISDSLTDALSKIAGVDVTQDSNDPNAAQTISLRGHDESQTAVTLDGIPLGAPGAATDLRKVNSDLFSGAGVSFGASAGSLGGSVNFRTLQPTQTWQSRFAGSYGTFDRYNYQVGETGSFGKLGIALLHTDRGGNNPLTFQNYLDQSGMAYPHGGESTNVGNFLKLRYSLSDRTTLNLTGLQNNQGSSLLCTQYVTLDPCGIGPGNVNFGRFGMAYATITSLVGETTFNVAGYVNVNTNTQDQSQRLLYGVNSPYIATTDSVARGIAFSATATHGRHTLTANGSTYAALTDFAPVINGSRFVVPSSSAVASRSYALQDAFKANDKLTLGLNSSIASTTGVGSSFLGGVSTTWRPTGSDSYSGSVSVGSSQPAAGLIRTFSDPRNARFNCYADTAQVNGPGDLPGPQSALNYDLSWTHQWRTGQVTLNGYRQMQTGQLINALVTGDSIALPSGYVSQIQQAFAAPTVCGSAFTPPPASNVYVSEPIGGSTRVYQGFDVTARLALGPNVVIIPSYTTTSAVVTAADARLTGTNSTVILGGQIPGRPLHRGNVTVDAFLPKSGFELLANAAYVGSNNSQHLAPYTLVNAGISHPLGIGRLTVFASNLFNTESGALSTLAYAQPIALSGGGSLLTAANPNTPRQWTVTYSFNTGARPGAGFSRGSAAASNTAATAQASGQGGGQGNRIQGRFKFTPPPPGTDPLALQPTSDSCPADAPAKAQPMLDQIKAAIADFKAGAPLPQINNTPVVAHGTPAGNWALEIAVLPRFGQGRPGGAPGANNSAPVAFQQRVVVGPGQGGFGGPGEGGPGGPGGPPPGAGGPPPGGAPGPAPSARPTPSPEQRARFEAIRAFVGCAYITALKSDEAKAKNIDVKGPAFGYAPQIGLFFVQPPDLGSGGGSLKQ